jgi:hypothetical protein
MKYKQIKSRLYELAGMEDLLWIHHKLSMEFRYQSWITTKYELYKHLVNS